MKADMFRNKFWEGLFRLIFAESPPGIGLGRPIFLRFYLEPF